MNLLTMINHLLSENKLHKNRISHCLKTFRYLFLQPNVFHSNYLIFVEKWM